MYANSSLKWEGIVKEVAFSTSFFHPVSPKKILFFLPVYSNV